jgi:UDP-N-acetylmuramoyl-tripeptide--D-alanyl-D-alanine ligase
MKSRSIFKKIIVKIITWQSKLVLLKYKPKIIAITGSVGKTSTKDAIFMIISNFVSVRKSEKSFNSEIGLPLTILGLPNGWNSFFLWFENIIKGFVLIFFKKDYPKYLILEVGVGKPGDIKKNVIPWLSPDIVVITRFPDSPVHVEFFGSADKVIEEKSALAFALKKNGLLILNRDDEKVYNLRGKIDRRTISYGQEEDSTYRASHPSYHFIEENGLNIPNGISFKLIYSGNTYPVIVPNIFGTHYMSSILAALACAGEIGCDLLQSIKHISNFKTPPGRLNLIRGINNSLIIDDSYNSSPVAMSAAMDVISEIEAKRKILIAGDMLELGRYTVEEHKKVGEKAKDIFDIIITVGPRAKVIAETALLNKVNKKNIYILDNHEQVSLLLKDFIKEGDVILVKGSQSVRLEKVTESIMLNPENKKDLLCRQEKEWRGR